jgi:hypothetical protein
MPPGATSTAHWFRGKNGWFTEHEEKILVNRVLRDEYVSHYPYICNTEAD